jgi:hypothetical protein
MVAFYPHIVWRFQNIGVIWSIMLYNSQGRGFKIVIVILHNYYTDKLVTVDKHYITYLGHGSLLSSHFVEVLENSIGVFWSILWYSDETVPRVDAS